MNTRSTDDGPFAWASKEALKLIHEHFSESNNLPSAYAVYMAMCIIASNEQSDTFTVKKALIAFRAGVSIRSVDSLQEQFVALGLLKVERRIVKGTTMKAPNTYTLLPMRNGCATMRNGCATMRNGRLQTFVADKVEESKKNLKEESGEEGAEAKAPVSANADTPPAEKPVASKQRKKLEQKPELAFPDPPTELASLPDFPEAWEGFKEMRSKKRKSLTALAAKLLLEKLGQRPHDAVAALHLSIEHSWQGVEWHYLDNHRVAGQAENNAHANGRPRRPAPIDMSKPFSVF